MICPEQFTPPAMSFAGQLLSIGQPVSKSSLKYMPLNFQSLVHGSSSSCLVPMFWFTGILSPTNSPFFQSDTYAVIPNKLPSLVSTADRQLYFWSKGLRSDKPSHKHHTNKYQTKAFVICDHNSDQKRSATHVSKTYLVWLMIDCYLIDTTSTTPMTSCVRGWT